MASANRDAQPRQRAPTRYVADMLRRIGELRSLDRLRREMPQPSLEFDEVARRIEQKSREVWGVINVPNPTVGPKSGGGWLVAGRSDTFKTQTDAIRAARAELTRSGGGELVIKGRNGKVREQSTIGRSDPRSSNG
jgi:hypothetical protein